jgi:hypothetical protein
MPIGRQGQAVEPTKSARQDGAARRGRLRSRAWLVGRLRLGPGMPSTVRPDPSTLGVVGHEAPAARAARRPVPGRSPGRDWPVALATGGCEPRPAPTRLGGARLGRVAAVRRGAAGGVPLTASVKEEWSWRSSRRRDSGAPISGNTISASPDARGPGARRHRPGSAGGTLTRDRMINPDLLRFMAARIGATTVEVRSSHASPASHPDLVAGLIRAAARVGVRGWADGRRLRMALARRTD